MNRRISKCAYGGGHACKRQGGSGAASHARGYTHAYPMVTETGSPVGDQVEPVQKSLEARVVHLDEVQASFDEDLSKSLLDVYVHQGADIVHTVRKSLYDFDLDSEEGIQKLLGMLPIMDVTILQEIAGEIWPGYPAQETDPDMLRAEVLGYLLDWQDGHGQADTK